MSSMIRTMYQDTLTNLYAGVVSAIDREVLSYSPLPSNIVDPYASQDVDPAGTMNMTYSAMVVWIDEAKKADYFSKHFVTLSRMIMNGTATMARGLVTMHGRGEDLSTAPMSIGDLISLSSYHFRKSYLGVIQTAKSKPEISERLLLNQLGWCNTLMRLYKTKEKLEKPAAVVGTHGSDSGLPENDRETSAIERTNAAGSLNEAHEAAALMPSSVKADQGVSALREPGSFTAPGAYNVIRAFTSFDHHDSAAKKSSRAMNAADNKKEGAAAVNGSKERENNKALMSGNEPGSSETEKSEKQDTLQKSQSSEKEQTEANEIASSSGNQSGRPEAVQPENEETLQKIQPDGKEKAEPEVKVSEKEEEIQKKNSEIKKPVNDILKSENPKTVPAQPEHEPEEKATAVHRTAHGEAVPDIPSEDDLTEGEKSILADARRFPDYLSRLRTNAADPDFLAFRPRLSTSYRRVLNVIDST